MDVDGGHIRSLLQDLLHCSINEARLSKLVQISRAICQSHLQYMRPSVLRLALHQGLTLTDLSYDCIAEAFTRDTDKRFPFIRSFADSLRASLDATPDHEVFLAFKGFLTRVADAQLARLYAQADPAGAKIHRNIREALKRSACFCLAKDFRGLVLIPVNGDSLEWMEPYPMDSVERSFLERAHNCQTIPQLLHILHEVVTKQTTYRRTIPLIDAVHLFKKLYVEGTAISTEVEEKIEPDGLSELEIARIQADVEIVLKEKIILTYLARGKLDRRQAEAIFDALSDMMKDWYSADETAFSLYDYLRRYMTIDENTYENTLRTKMEYLLKIARQEFAARLMKEL